MLVPLSWKAPPVVLMLPLLVMVVAPLMAPALVIPPLLLLRPPDMLAAPVMFRPPVPCSEPLPALTPTAVRAPVLLILATVPPPLARKSVMSPPPEAPWMTAVTLLATPLILKLALVCWVVWLLMKEPGVAAQLARLTKQTVSLLPAVSGMVI